MVIVWKNSELVISSSVSVSAMGGATMIIIYRTESVFKNIVLFWVLCALDVNCIQPITRLKCDGFWNGTYAGKTMPLSLDL